VNRRDFLMGSGFSLIALALGGCDVLSRRLLMGGGSGGGFSAPSPLARYRDALAGRATSPVDIVCIGNSITEGYFASSLANRWVEQILAALNTTYGSGTNVSIYRAGAWGDPAIPPLTLPWTLTNASPGNSWGFGRKFNNMSAGAQMSLAATSTGFSIVYSQGPSADGFGSFKYAVDGGATTTVNAVNATTLSGRLETVSGLSLASHSVVITPDTANAPIDGIIFYNGNETNGIRVWEGGHSGFLASDFLDPAKPHWIDLLGNISPDLAIIMLGRNEWVTGVSTGTFIANLATLIANVRATASPAPSILIVAEPQGDYAPGPLWSSYVTAMANLVASDGNLAYVDLNPGFGGYTVPPSGPLYNADLKHPSGAGEDEIAAEIMALIG